MSYFEKACMAAECICQKEHVKILGIESSCDESAAAVVADGRCILSDAVYSQVDLHALYGGVVPEIASRSHIEKIDLMVDRALEEAGERLETIDAIAVTCGPGLVGSLLTGVTCAKCLAYAMDKPLIPVNHIEGHICANYLTDQELTPPFVCLVASGGHSHIILVNDYGEYTLLGCTRDDAAGEAFDKAARVLNLPYPGGPRLDELAEQGNPHALKLPVPHTEGPFDFSFSGLKTAFINAVHHARQTGEQPPRADWAASFRYAVVTALVTKTLAAAKANSMNKIAIAGGVSANRLLRREMAAACEREGILYYEPRLDLCGDNAAMIASAGFFRLRKGVLADMTLNAQPALQLV